MCFQTMKKPIFSPKEVRCNKKCNISSLRIFPIVKLCCWIVVLKSCSHFARLILFNSMRQFKRSIIMPSLAQIYFITFMNINTKSIKIYKKNIFSFWSERTCVKGLNKRQLTCSTILVGQILNKKVYMMTLVSESAKTWNSLNFTLK